MSVLPRAAQPFVTFPALLRANGFAVAPEQTATFLEAVGLLGPRSIADIRRAAHATLAPPPDRRAAFDALFGAHFLGEMEEGEALGEPEDETVRVQEERAGGAEPLISDEVNEAGQEATAAEALSVRRFGPASDHEVLRRFARSAPLHLPRRPGYRRMRARRGEYFDTRRTLREAVRNDGDVMTLRRLKRRLRQRRILLLIDVSGSMKERTEQHLRIAHALAHAVERIEVFTFGTRLTRVTRAMRLKNRDMALAATSSIVSDWDGGTRIGEALQAFLAVPRFAGYARGAVVLILSDGLERGDVSRDARGRDAALAARLACVVAHAARRRSEFHAADRRAEGDPAAGRRSRRRLVGRAPSARTSSIWKASGPHDRYRRRAPSHLAAGRHAVALRPDAAAHLRAVRADPPRLSDRRVPGRPVRHRRRQVGVRAGQLAEGEIRGRGRVGERGGGHARLAAWHRRLCGRHRR